MGFSDDVTRWLNKPTVEPRLVVSPDTPERFAGNARVVCDQLLPLLRQIAREENESYLSFGRRYEEWLGERHRRGERMPDTDDLFSAYLERHCTLVGPHVTPRQMSRQRSCAWQYPSIYSFLGWGCTLTFSQRSAKLVHLEMSFPFANDTGWARHMDFPEGPHTERLRFTLRDPDLSGTWLVDAVECCHDGRHAWLTSL